MLADFYTFPACSPSYIYGKKEESCCKTFQHFATALFQPFRNQRYFCKIKNQKARKTMLIKGIECCDDHEIHQPLLDIVKEQMPEEETLYNLAELFKVFGDSTRIRILFVLFEAEVCVCDLAHALNMTQSAISHQLRILKQNKLVKHRREGKSIFYSLADEHVRTIIAQGLDHILED